MSCRFTIRRAFTSRRASIGFWARKPSATYVPFASSEVEMPLGRAHRWVSRLRSTRTELRQQRHTTRVQVTVRQNTDTQPFIRTEEHPSEIQYLLRIPYAD